jgi:hypothetical protein
VTFHGDAVIHEFGAQAHSGSQALRAVCPAIEFSAPPVVMQFDPARNVRQVDFWVGVDAAAASFNDVVAVETWGVVITSHRVKRGTPGAPSWATMPVAEDVRIATQSYELPARASIFVRITAPLTMPPITTVLVANEGPHAMVIDDLVYRGDPVMAPPATRPPRVALEGPRIVERSESPAGSMRPSSYTWPRTLA